MSLAFWEQAILKLCSKMKMDKSLMTTAFLKDVRKAYEAESAHTWSGLALGDVGAWELLRKVCMEKMKDAVERASKDTSDTQESKGE